jgi:HEAT repeat protein
MRAHRDKLLFVCLVTVLPLTEGCGGPKRVEHSVPSLVKTLNEDKDPNMRYWAAESLGKFGREAQPAVPDLIAALKDESKMVRMGVAYALGEIGSTDAVPALQTAGNDAEKEVRDAAAFALKQIHNKGKKR